MSAVLSCLVVSTLSAPAPQPIFWPGLAAVGAGAIGFELATGLTLAGAGAATIPTSLLVAKALAAKKIAILGALAASRSGRNNGRRNGRR